MNQYFYNLAGENLPLQNQFAGQSCFIVSGGPSLKTLDLSKLNNAGIFTIGINNSPRVFRPNAWISVDDPANFMISIWRDPKIMKFVMLGKRGKLLWDNNEWRESRYLVRDCPNVVCYKDNEHFKPTDEYLTEETINWGNHTNRCECGEMRESKDIKTCPKCGKNMFGCRSVILAAIKIAYVLGFRKVFIIGADFKMDESNTYAWNQARAGGSIRNNNITYRKLNERFNLLRPVFERNNFYVFNASGQESGLNSFIKIDFDEAMRIALRDFPEVEKERTFGMYERKAVNEAVEKRNIEIMDLKEKIVKVNGSDRRLTKRLNQKLEKAKVKLVNALQEREKILTCKV